MFQKKDRERVSLMGKEILSILSSVRECDSLAIALQLHQTRVGKRRLSTHSLRQSLGRLERHGLIAIRLEETSESNELDLKIKYYRITKGGLNFLRKK